MADIYFSFEEARKKYKTKKRAGENTREDDINYLTLITKEQIRETQFQKCQKAILEMLEWYSVTHFCHNVAFIYLQ